VVRALTAAACGVTLLLWQTAWSAGVFIIYRRAKPMKCIKKLVALTLAAVLALTMLTACGGTPSVPETTEETKQIVDNINAVRTENGLSALEINTAVTDVAQKYLAVQEKKKLNLISEENYKKEMRELSAIKVAGRSYIGYLATTTDSSGEKSLTKEAWQKTYDSGKVNYSDYRIVHSADAKYVGVVMKQISNGKYITVVVTY
jgi:hypothetical protein